ncbi:DUF1109 domain-containing protein [Novosphingobium sp. BL-52-GroH]|uniref:DUF1109 domain-containing protein n=1 Tax=Novosphingobium sp. BL-52-GroH TaxID=3349877 RepID=UPI00384E4DB3
MNTDDLIRELAREVGPVSRNAMRHRIVIGAVAGGIVSAVLIVLSLGPRADLAVAMGGFSFWMKWSFTLSLAVAGMAMAMQLARPDGGRLRGLWLGTVPVALLVGVGLVELTQTPSADWLAMWLGHSWQVCSLIVFTLSIPIFAGLLWAFRRLAPTRLRAAGAAAGLLSGAFSATIYCIHCPEVSAIFVLTWYSLGILLATLLGALLGPRLLRW